MIELMRPTLRTLSLCTLIFALLPMLAADRPHLNGKVVGLSDRDTLKLLVDRTEHKIRLDGIDAPESHQAFGTKSKQALGDKTFSKPVWAVDKGRDRYGRTLGVVWIDKRNINLEIVSDGFAWHYKQFSKDKELADAETAARKAKHGLWFDAHPTPPWEFRKPPGVSDSAPTQTADEGQSVFISASGKKYHRDGCRTLKDKVSEIPLDVAKSRYEPCPVCKPPR